MAVEKTTTDLVVRLGSAVEVLDGWLDGSDNVQDFLEHLGLAQVSSVLTGDQAFMSSVTTLHQSVTQTKTQTQNLVAAIIEQRTADIATRTTQLISTLNKVAQHMHSLEQETQRLASNNSAIDEFIPRMLSWMTGYSLYTYHPRVLALLAFTGIDDVQTTTIDGDEYSFSRFRPQRLLDMVQEPSAVLADVYGWDGGTPQTKAMLERLHYALYVLGSLAHTLNHNDDGSVTLQLGNLDLQSSSSQITATLHQTFADGFSKIYHIAPDTVLEYSVKGTFHAGATVTIQPVATIEVAPSPDANEVAGNISLAIRRSAENSSRPEPILEAPGGIVLKATELALRLGAALEWDAQSQKAVGSLLIEAEWKGGQVAFSFEQADSFLKQVIPLDALSLDFDALLRWTESSGLTFQGGAGLHYSRALHKSIGPLTLRQLDIVIAPSEKGVSLEASSSINLNIGPFSATVERMGLELGANGSDSQYIAFGAGFKPPRGLALSINASAVTGGGYLFFDPENKRYAGAVQLSFTQLSLAAIGLLTTQLPDGSDGFSFLIIITAEFPPLQLGFGFTLNGVGGLVGIHRKVVTQAIRKGLHNQTLDSILFPENPVENAPRIISDLRTVFPPVHGQFTFGPMAILGWGVPQTLVSLKLGIIIEMPSPLRLVILGQLRTRIPSEEAALIRLNMDVLGIIDFHAQRASVDAVLYDSRLTQFTLSGEMAMRMRWGNKPAFLMAVGGFNARFNPPDEFPELDRISISRDLGIAKLTLKTYLAVTSNTLQFGAALRVYASAAKFSLEAELAFHVLIQFEPFRFVADIDGSASIKRGGNSIASVGFHGKLAGPSPWRARGKASVSIGFIKAKVSFNKTFGQAEQPSTPSTNIWPDLQKALEAQQSWNAQLPADDTMLVSLRKVSSSDENDEVLVHPLGALSVEQKIVPLDTAVEKYGGYNVEGQRLFRLTGVALARRSLTFTTSQRTEQFAPAKYFNISEKEKLEGPSFETFAAGQDIEMKTDPSDIATARDPQPKETEYGYDTTLIDEPLPEDMQQQASTPTYKVEKSMLMASAHMGAKAQASRSGPARFAAPGKGVQTGPVTYTLADADTLDAMQLDTVSPQDVARTLRAGHHTYTAARQALKQYEQAHPRRRGQYIIAAEHEVTGGSNG